MKKALKRIESRITRMHDGITGDLSNVSGNLTGVRGDLTGVSGDLDLCEITEEERAAGVNINDLIEP